MPSSTKRDSITATKYDSRSKKRRRRHLHGDDPYRIHPVHMEWAAGCPWPADEPIPLVGIRRCGEEMG